MERHIERLRARRALQAFIGSRPARASASASLVIGRVAGRVFDTRRDYSAVDEPPAPRGLAINLSRGASSPLLVDATGRELLTDSLKQLPSLKANILQGAPAYFPPGYPMLVGLAYLISRTLTGLVITMLQHVMMIATIWWCYRLLERSAGTTVSFATALIIGAAAPTLVLPQGILLSENVALFGMAGTLYFAFNYRETGRLRRNPRRRPTGVGYIGPRSTDGGRSTVGTRDHDGRRASRGRSA